MAQGYMVSFIKLNLDKPALIQFAVYQGCYFLINTISNIDPTPAIHSISRYTTTPSHTTVRPVYYQPERGLQ